MWTYFPSIVAFFGCVVAALALRDIARAPAKQALAGLSLAALYTVAMSADRISPIPSSQTLRVAIAMGAGLILLLVARRAGERHSVPPLTAFFLLLVSCSLWTFSVNVVLAPSAPMVDTFGRIAPLITVGCLFVAIRTGSVNWRLWNR